MRGSQSPNPALEKLMADAIRAARGESVDPAAIIVNNDKDIAR